jgi:hypothetical protein
MGTAQPYKKIPPGISFDYIQADVMPDMMPNMMPNMMNVWLLNEFALVNRDNPLNDKKEKPPG